MSASGKALAQAIGGFGQSVQNLGETIYKVDADNEATKIQLSLAAQIEEFQKNLLTDPDPGTPGATTPEGYLAKWEKFSQDLQSQAGKAKNPLARQEVTNYLGKVLPNQGTNVAKLQLAAWSENQKVDRRTRVLEAALVRAPEEAFNIAATEYGFLLKHNAITAAEYASLMNEASAPILEKALYQKGMEAFKTGGEDAAESALHDQVLFKTDKDTFIVSDAIRDRVRQRVDADIQLEYSKTRTALGVLQSNTYAKAMGKPNLDQNGNELPIMSLKAIDEAKLPEKDKEGLRAWYFGMNKEIVDAEFTSAETDLWKAFDILHKINKGEAVTEEERKLALNSAMVDKLNLPSSRRSFWTGLIQSEEQIAKTNEIETQRTTTGKAMAALRRAAYSPDGKASPEDEALIGSLTDTWLDSFGKIPANELSGLKDERARLQKMRADRQNQTTSTTNENVVYDLFGKLAGAASGLNYNEADLPKEAEVAAAIAKIDPTRQGAFRQEATQLYTSIAKQKQAQTNDQAFWNLAKQADAYRDTGAGLSIDDITKAVNEKTITSSQATYLTNQMNQADDVKKAETLAKQKGEDALARYKSASEAFRNLQKQNAGEKLPEGAPVLTPEYARTLGLDANELQYWDGVIDRTAAAKKQLDAIKDQGSREKKLAAALANSYAAIREGKEDPTKPGISQEMVEKAFAGVDDPEGYKSWVSVAEQIKAATTKKAEDADAEAWRQKMWKAEAVSERKARGEDVGEEQGLSTKLINEAPAVVKEEEKAYYSRRITTIGDTAQRFRVQKDQDEFYVLLGNTMRMANGEDMKGLPILTFDKIWNNESLSIDMKMSADKYLRSATGSKGNDPSEADKLISLDYLEAGALILQRIKGGDTRNTKWTYVKKGQSFTIDLAKDGEAEWNRVVNEMTPFISGHTAEVEKYRGYLTEKKVDNPRHKLVDETIADYEKNQLRGKSLDTTFKQNLKDWAYRQADLNPAMDGGKFVSLVQSGITAKTIGFNFKAGMDLTLSKRTNAEDFVAWVSEGKGSQYMGRTQDGLPKPMHPAVLDEMDQFAGKFREAIKIIPNGSKVVIGPTGNAIEYWGADGQRWVTIDRSQAGKKADELFRSLKVPSKTENVQTVQFFLGNVDESRGDVQAHIMMRVLLKDGGGYDLALYNQEWQSAYPTEKPYTYDSVKKRTTAPAEQPKKPGDPGFVVPNSVYPGLW